MNHLFKQQSIQSLVKYNQHLLIITLTLSVTTLISVVSLINREEKWLLIPAIESDRRMSVSSSIYHETYLKEWAEFVMRELFYTSPERVESQIANIKIISSSNLQLDKFFKEHLQFVKGSNVSSTFFLKTPKVVDSGVLITGTFHYWFGGSDKQVAEEKTYLLGYKRGVRGVLLLTSVEEQIR
ncbi:MULTISPECIES: TraE/TraK family type IV conjugative transfer system protein [unclassified Candidatus Tisiphia]|uniref:TraE/TraK family type IV conjugative transfer system protein n=1 Tax=unclassified Candidatus Tisiphia TaxID=2996318 RepID=UPI00312CA076